MSWQPVSGPYNPVRRPIPLSGGVGPPERRTRRLSAAERSRHRDPGEA